MHLTVCLNGRAHQLHIMLKHVKEMRLLKLTYMYCYAPLICLRQMALYKYVSID